MYIYIIYIIYILYISKYENLILIDDFNAGVEDTNKKILL